MRRKCGGIRIVHLHVLLFRARTSPSSHSILSVVKNKIQSLVHNETGFLFSFLELLIFILSKAEP